MNKNRLLVVVAALVWGTVFFHTNIVYAAPNTQTGGQWQESDNGQWFYYDAGGNLCTGWIIVGGKHYYLYEDGHCAMNEVTPDGYRVDEHGAWFQLTRTILGHEFVVPVQFLNPDRAGADWGGAKSSFDGLSQTVLGAFGGVRKLSVTADSVEYISVNDGTRDLGLYKDPSGGYRLDIRMKLDRYGTDMDQASTYDYGVFQALVCSITSTPDQLCEAILSSWQEENTYGISRTAFTPVGDCTVRYEAGQGYGKFFIRP